MPVGNTLFEPILQCVSRYTATRLVIIIIIIISSILKKESIIKVLCRAFVKSELCKVLYEELYVCSGIDIQGA